MPTKKSQIDEILDRELKATSATQPSSSLPTTLPETFPDNSLIPRLATTDAGKLEEYRVRVAAQQMGVDPHIAAGVAMQESSFNPNATSNTGVRGTMQVTQATAKDLGFDRNNPDQNIMAGVALLKKGLDRHPDNLEKALSIYPAPKDRNFWIPSVMEYANKSKSVDSQSIDDILSQHGIPPSNGAEQLLQPAATDSTPPASSTGLTGSILAGSKGYIDALGLGNIQRNFGKGVDILGALLGQGNLNNVTPQSLEAAAQKRENITAQAQGEHPITSTLGTVGGVAGAAALLNPVTTAAGEALAATSGASKLAEIAPTLSKIAGASAEGAASNALYTGATNALEGKDVTGEDLIKSGLIGGTIAGSLPLAGKAIGTAGKLGTKVTQGLKTNSSVADYIQKDLGFSLTQKGLAAKNLKVLSNTERELQSVLDKADKAGKLVDLGEHLYPEDLMKIGLRKQASGLNQEAVDIFNWVKEAETLAGPNSPYGKVRLSTANKIKRLLWDESKFKASGDPGVSDQAQAAYEAGNYIKNQIEEKTKDLLVGTKVRDLNTKLKHGIELRNAIDSQGNRRLGTLANAITGGALLSGAASGNPLLMGGAALGTTAGSTAAMQAGQTLENLPKEIQQVLPILIPNLFKSQD